MSTSPDNRTRSKSPLNRRLASILPAAAAIILIVLAFLAAGVSVRAGFQFLPGLNIERTPLAAAPRLASVGGPSLSSRVVLVITDGLRLDTSLEMPFLNKLRANGAYGRATSHAPTISRPNYVSIVTGVPPSSSGVRNNDFDWQVRLDSVMARVADSGRSAAYVADYSSGFPRLFFDVLEDMSYAPWPGGFAKAASLALRRDFPLVILLPGSVDENGHGHGADSDEYRTAAVTLDAELERILAALDLERSTIVIVSDHGHTDGGGHGGLEKEVVDVPILFAGAGIREHIVLDGVRLIDVSPTIAALLGVGAPGHALGRTVTEVLDVDQARMAEIEKADEQRIERNEAVVSEGRSRARKRVLRTRAKRVAALIVIGFLGFAILLLGHRTKALTIDSLAIILTVPVFPAALYGLLHFAGDLSLSSLPDEGSGTRQMLYFGFLAIAVHIITVTLLLRRRFTVTQRLTAANAVAVCGLVVSSLPALFAWAIFGGGPHVILPAGAMLFVIPALYLAVATYAVAAAVTLAIELIVFFARVSDPTKPTRKLETKLKRARRLSEQVEIQTGQARDDQRAEK